MMNEIRTRSIRELVEGLNGHLAEVGYSPNTIARYNAHWRKLIEYADDYGNENFSMEFARTFVGDVFGAILGDKDASHNINRAIHMLADFEHYGMVFKQSSLTLKGFSTGYKSLLENFLEHLRNTGTSDGSIKTWRSRLFRFEYFLLQNGITAFNQIERHHMLTYAESLVCYSSGTVGATITVLDRLFCYAIEKGFHHANHVESLPPIRRMNKYRLPHVFTPTEVECILKTASKDDPLGKRNYAILLLVARSGLRIGDVRGLRFENLDWENRRISIIQGKTQIPHEIPLLEDVGWAIIDYMQNGRPETDCPCIFVRHRAPYEGFTDSLQRIMVQSVRKAGVAVPTDKSIGMHTFRHSMATSLLKTGATYTEIALTLGHSRPESTQRYISLDEEQLRQCALEVTFQ